MGNNETLCRVLEVDPIECFRHDAPKEAVIVLIHRGVVYGFEIKPAQGGRVSRAQAICHETLARCRRQLAQLPASASHFLAHEVDAPPA
jgi:hypothetical protein